MAFRRATVEPGICLCVCMSRSLLGCGWHKRIEINTIRTRSERKMEITKDTFVGYRVAVLLPCYNEELSIAEVVRAFATVLPAAVIYVYDNMSTDRTAEVALAAGAVVRREQVPGKGSVVRRMFADIDADIYLMADGDGTYDADAAREMIDLLIAEHLDMVVGTRIGIYDDAHRIGHGAGNRLFNAVYRALFGPLFKDIFSGYRIFSRRFIKTFPAVSSGFEIEAEMSVHASQIRIPIAEFPTKYGARKEGSQSKLRTFRDAARILWTFFLFFKEIKPLLFFSVVACCLFLLSLLLGVPLAITYAQTGLVPRVPTAILSTGLGILGGISMTCGLVLDSVARGRLENKRLAYLAQNPL